MRGYFRPILFVGLVMFLLLSGNTALAQAFHGGGASMFMGSGSPGKISSASDLADDLLIDDERGYFVFGLHGFYQADQFRVGVAVQLHEWAGLDASSSEADEDTAGVAATIFGLYGAYTVRHDRMLLNVGATLGFGKTVFGYSLSEDRGDIDDDVSESTLYFEPFVSLGIATTRWFGIEAQLSAPIFMLSEDMDLIVKNKKYTVSGSEMNGLIFTLKFTFGKIADF